MSRGRLYARGEYARVESRVCGGEAQAFELRRGRARGRTSRRMFERGGELESVAVETRGGVGAFREGRAKEFVELFARAADAYVSAFVRAHGVCVRERPHARRLDGKLREDSLVNPPRPPTGAKARALLERVAERLERSAATANARRALDETDAHAARREERGRRQT